MKQATEFKSQIAHTQIMQHDAPNTRHPLFSGGDRERQRVADLGKVVSILARQYAGEADGKEAVDGQGQ